MRLITKQYVKEYGSDDDFEYFFWFEFLPQETAADKVVSK